MIGAIIVTIKVESSAAKYWLSMLGNTFSGVGLAVLIAGVFNFIIGTRDFLNYIRDRLVEIVLSKEFVTRLSEDDQKKLLKITMKPSREISSIYSGIDDCFDGYVSQSMALFDSSYRGQMYISAVASFDKDRNTTRIDWDLNYVVYRVAGKFEPMPFWFGNEKSIHVKTTITADKNDIEVLTEKDLKGAENKDPSMAIGFTVDVPDRY